jgi:NAD(P)-dependent dehydrogenase (short-subunit alcohol dehydrogenase family)
MPRRASSDPAAIVTGGGGGIGRAAALALAAGAARVLVVDLDGGRAEETAAAVSDAGGTASVAVADVTDPDAVAGYVAECEQRYGGVDAFFNNAAYEGAIAEIPDYPLDEFERTMAVNVRGVFLGLQHVIPALRRRGGGAIVNVSSQAGLRGVPNLSVYSASKHAVIGLTRAAALELARESIRVNAVCPGPTDTRMMRDIEEVVRSRGGDPSAFAERIPVGRYGRPDEIAALVAWLLLEAPPFLTGAVLPIDGGMTVP